MYRIKTMNKIASAGLDQLDKSRFQVGEDVENEDGILVRSAKMHDYVFPDALRAKNIPFLREGRKFFHVRLAIGLLYIFPKAFTISLFVSQNTYVFS